MEKPCANSQRKDAERLMRPTHVKPPNTNTLNAVHLERGCSARFFLPLVALKQTPKEVLGARGEVKYQVECESDNDVEDT